MGQQIGGMKKIETRILIVDDEVLILEMIDRFLAKTDYILKFVRSVEEARFELGQNHYDLILCDLKMPVEPGVELIKQVNYEYPKTGVVVVTGATDLEEAKDILNHGVYGYLFKPLNRTMLIVTIENALRHLRLNLQMEAHKGKLEEKVHNRGETLAVIMDNLDIGVIMIDTQLNVVEVNRKMIDWFPETSDSSGDKCYHTFATARKMNPCDDCPLEETFLTGLNAERSLRLTTRDGERDFRVIITPIKDKRGEIIAGIELLEDITERLVIEKELLQSQKLEAVGQLAAGIVHEINSPIQYVSDNLNFLQDSYKDFDGLIEFFQKTFDTLHDSKTIDQKLVSHVKDAVEEADLVYLREEIPKTLQQSLDGVGRVGKIVRAMKEFSHPGNDEKVMTNINSILENTVTISRNEWKYVAEIELNLQKDLNEIPCLAGELNQVFLNIIVNAAHAIADATNNGESGLGTILISSKNVENGVLISLEDNGAGIPEEVQKRIFEPFFTTKERGKGTGQGLAIARGVVGKHHGDLSVLSEVGKGTTFYIKLPLAGSTFADGEV